MAYWGINGFVYSMAHGWGPKPLENLQSFAGTNGDGTLLYPSELVGGSGPMPSIRLMLLRDAIEDYELLQLLRTQRGAATFCKTIGMGGPVPWRIEATRQNVLDILAGRRLRSSSTDEALAPRKFPFPATPTRDELPVGGANNFQVPAAAPPIIDGWVHDSTWNESTRCLVGFFRGAEDGDPHLFTTLWLTHDATTLYVAMRCHGASPVMPGEWVAVDLAPADAHERWRFRVTAAGQKSVEHHTREGQFAAEGLSWQAKAKVFSGFYDVEMKIPLSVIGNPHTFRCNAARRVNDVEHGLRYTVRAWPDANDTYLMPLVRIGGMTTGG